MLAGAGGLFALVMQLGAFLPGRPLVHSSHWWYVGVLAVVLVVWTGLGRRVGSGAGAEVPFGSHLPAYQPTLSTAEAAMPSRDGSLGLTIKWVARLVLVAAVLGLIGYKGVPEIRNGRYVANNHGHLTALSYDGYERQVAVEQRFLGGIAASALLSVALAGFTRAPVRPET